MHWHSCPGSGGSPSLKVFQNRGDVALKNMVGGHAGVDLAWGSWRACPTPMIGYVRLVASYTEGKKQT